MSTLFSLTKDIHGQNGMVLPFSNQNSQVTVAYGFTQEVQAPTEYPKYIAVFTITAESLTSGDEVYITTKYLFDHQNYLPTYNPYKLSPTSISINGGDLLYIAGAREVDTGVIVNISFYALPAK